MRFAITIIVILLIIAYYIKYIIDSFDIKFNELSNISLTGLDFNSLNSNQTVIVTRVKLIIILSSLFKKISISNLNIRAFSNGLLIAESTKGILENTKQINLYSDINNVVYQTFDFHFNNELIKLIGKIKLKQKYKIDYQASFKILGITIKKTGIYENN